MGRFRGNNPFFFFPKRFASNFELDSGGVVEDKN